MSRAKVLEVLEANVGGARKHVAQLLGGLVERGFECHLACSLKRDRAALGELGVLAARGVRIIPVRMLRRPAPLSDFAALRALTGLMRAERYDIVHTHAAKGGFLGRLAARRAGVPAVLHTPHTFPFERRDTPLTRLYRALERRAAAWADRLVLVSPSQRETALRAGIGAPEKLVVVENGISLPATEPAATRQKFRCELGLDPAELAAAFVGRLTPQKDVQTFLSAGAVLAREMPGVKLFIVGAALSPQDHRYVRRLSPAPCPHALSLLSPQSAIRNPQSAIWSPVLPIRVLGHRADAAELVAAFDVVILPSLYEGLPYSLLEAMAQGVPVVASDVAGNRDVIEHGVSGVLVPPGDAGVFAGETQRLLGDEGRRRAMGEAARRRVTSEFTEGRFLERMAKLYEEMLHLAAQRRAIGG